MTNTAVQLSAALIDFSLRAADRFPSILLFCPLDAPGSSWFRARNFVEAAFCNYISGTKHASALRPEQISTTDGAG